MAALVDAPQTKLTMDEVRQIRAIYHERNPPPLRVTGDQFGVGWQYVLRLVHGDDRWDAEPPPGCEPLPHWERTWERTTRPIPSVDTFAGLLRSFREREGFSRATLARKAGVDASYITRIEWEDRPPPQQHIVAGLARALGLTVSERAQLMAKAGYTPDSVSVTGWHPALQAVSEVLGDSNLAPEERERFGSIVAEIAAHWRTA